MSIMGLISGHGLSQIIRSTRFNDRKGSIPQLYQMVGAPLMGLLRSQWKMRRLAQRLTLVGKEEVSLSRNLANCGCIQWNMERLLQTSWRKRRLSTQAVGGKYGISFC